jgi:DNA-binding NarL/FixJ family response regulator
MIASGRAAELVALIGESALIALAEAFGGTRLYVPATLDDSHRIVRAIGPDAAQALCRQFGPATIRVPLAREPRAVRYRSEGLSNARIAARLGLTEGGVSGLFKRIDGGRNGGVAHSSTQAGVQ